MQTSSRRVLLVTSAILGLAASVSLASAAPLQDGAAAVVAKTQAPAADAPRVEKAWYHHRWHRHYWHRRWHRHHW